MVSYFSKKNNGIISVFLILVLTAIIGSSSTLIEIARYRSNRGLFREMAGNAAFSALAQYDRDLFEQYGIFAMDQSDSNMAAKIVKEQLSINTNSVNSSAVLADNKMTVGDVDVTPIFSLHDGDILKRQIYEYGKYRAPIYVVNKLADLEDKLKELIDKLESNIGALDTMEKATDKMAVFTDAAADITDFGKEIKAVLNDFSKYKEKIDRFNEKVRALKDVIDDEPSRSSEEWDDWKEDFDAAVAAVKEAGNDAKGMIDSLKEHKETLKTKWSKAKDSMESFKESVSGNELISADGQSGDAATEEGYAESFESTDQTIDRINDTMGGVSDDEIDAFFDDMIDQKTDLSEGEDAEEVTAVRLFADETKLKETSDKLTQTEKEMEAGWDDYYSQINTMLKLTRDLIGNSGFYEGEYNNEVSFGSGTASAVEFSYIDAPTFAIDINEIQELLNDAANTIGNGASIPQLRDEENPLVIAMENFSDSLEKFKEDLEDMKDLKNKGGLLTRLRALRNTVKSFQKFIGATVELVKTFIDVGSGGIINLLYESLIIDLYAANMFSCRTTDIGADRNLSGKSFPDKEAGSTHFKKCDVEYVLCGDSKEINNQSKTYGLLLCIRLLANIAPVLKDGLVQAIASALAIIPFIGAFLSVMIRILWVVVESYLDMMILVSMRDSVPLMKQDIYLSIPGVPKFLSKLTKYYEKGGGQLEIDEDTLKDVTNNFTEKAQEKLNVSNINLSGEGDGWVPMTYQQYLIVLLLFKGQKKNVQRIGDLIQSEMNRRKSMTNYQLAKAYTYLRVKANAAYKPILPMLNIANGNATILRMDTIEYVGY